MKIDFFWAAMIKKYRNHEQPKFCMDDTLTKRYYVQFFHISIPNLHTTLHRRSPLPHTFNKRIIVFQNKVEPLSKISDKGISRYAETPVQSSRNIKT